MPNFHTQTNIVPFAVNVPIACNNVLVMPGLHSANPSAKLLRELAGNATIGPMLIGMEKPVQIAPMTASAPDVLTLAVLAAAGVVG